MNREALNKELRKCVYARYSGQKKLVQTARVYFMGIGKYAFETSLFGAGPYEGNINMPTFDTERQARKWIEQTGKWEVLS